MSQEAIEKLKAFAGVWQPPQVLEPVKEGDSIPGREQGIIKDEDLPVWWGAWQAVRKRKRYRIVIMPGTWYDPPKEVDGVPVMMPWDVDSTPDDQGPPYHTGCWGQGPTEGCRLPEGTDVWWCELGCHCYHPQKQCGTKYKYTIDMDSNTSGILVEELTVEAALATIRRQIHYWENRSDSVDPHPEKVRPQNTFFWSYTTDVTFSMILAPPAPPRDLAKEKRAMETLIALATK